MHKIETYSYVGPLALGSVVAHHCAAAGLFAVKGGADIELLGETLGGDNLALLVKSIGKNRLQLKGNNTPQGRQTIGKSLLKFLRQEQGLSPLGSWGSLVGVRPTKLFHKKWDDLGSSQAARETIGQQYEVSQEKLALLEKIAVLQRPYLLISQKNDRQVSLYGGIPFCQTRCLYCSFPYGLIGDYLRLSTFLQTYKQDIGHMQGLLRQYDLQVDALYLGGGTPTVLSDSDFTDWLVVMKQLLINQESCEFTVEAGRPDSITEAKLQAMVRAGVTRISLNPQTMQDSILRAIGRGHRASDILAIYKKVRKQTDFQINMDFIAGLPGQSMAAMKENAQHIGNLLPDNVTVHTLTLKKGSLLYTSPLRRDLPDESEVQIMTTFMRDYLHKLGYVPYYVYRQQYMRGHLENIGYTRPGAVCRYNIHIMEERQPLLSMGPGSSSKWMRAPDYRQQKMYMPKDVDTYIDTIGTLLAKRAKQSQTFWEE